MPDQPCKSQNACSITWNERWSEIHPFYYVNNHVFPLRYLQKRRWLLKWQRSQRKVCQSLPANYRQVPSWSSCCLLTAPVFHRGSNYSHPPHQISPEIDSEWVLASRGLRGTVTQLPLWLWSSSLPSVCWHHWFSERLVEFYRLTEILIDVRSSWRISSWTLNKRG